MMMMMKERYKKKKERESKRKRRKGGKIRRRKRSPSKELREPVIPQLGLLKMGMKAVSLLIKKEEERMATITIL